MNGLSLVNLVSNADAIPYFTGVHDSDHQQIGIYLGKMSRVLFRLTICHVSLLTFVKYVSLF